MGATRAGPCRSVCGVTATGSRLAAAFPLIAVGWLSGATGAAAATGHDDRPRAFAVGDSVRRGARSCLQKRGYRVAARGSRQASAANLVLRSHKHLPAQVIVHTGTNGGAHRSDLARIMRTVGAGHDVIWVTVQLPDDTSRYTFEDATNEAIRSMPHRFPNAFLADWNLLSDRHPGWTWGDGIHLTSKGCYGYARMIARAVRTAQLSHHYVPMGHLLPTGAF